MHSEFFSQSEFEAAIYKCLEHGDEVHLAEDCDAGYGVMSQYLSPNNERQSPMFKAATVLAAWLARDPDGGECALTTFESFVRRAKPKTIRLNLTDARRNSHKERADVHIAEAEGKSLEDTIHELRESIEADRKWLASLEQEHERAKQREAFKGQPVSHNARSLGRAAVGGRKNG